jgi:hypothetical protein
MLKKITPAPEIAKVLVEPWRPGTYLAFVLSDETRSKLLSLFPPEHEKSVCHHVTFKFGVKQEFYDEMLAYFTVSHTPLSVEATGFSSFAGLDVLSVNVNGQSVRHFDDSFYHVTHSRSVDRKARDSKIELDAVKGAPHFLFDAPIPLGGVLRLVNM